MPIPAYQPLVVHRLAVAEPYVESFGSRVRDELVAVELFSCLAEGQVLVEDWRQDYNTNPHRVRHRLPGFMDALAPTLQPTPGHRLPQQVDRGGR
jgi:hypothetical protein